MAGHDRSGVARAVRFLHHAWGIPLLSEPVRPGDTSLGPESVLRMSLPWADARLIMGLAAWLSLVDPSVRLGDEWDLVDRRRVAYLCEIARCLARLRGETRPHSWPRRVAGISLSAWADRVPLFKSGAPPLPSSIFGTRWGIIEVIPFSDYAEFQRAFLWRQGTGWLRDPGPRNRPPAPGGP